MRVYDLGPTIRDRTIKLLSGEAPCTARANFQFVPAVAVDE